MASRKLEDLHPEIVSRWLKAVEGWNKLRNIEPELPDVFITCTYRSPEEQTELYAQGRTKPGPIVTHAEAYQSLHNYKPSFAVDFAFRKGKEVFWNEEFFRRFAQIAKSYGLAWGGDWPGRKKDTPHLEPPQFTWRDARAGKEPTW